MKRFSFLLPLLALASPVLAQSTGSLAYGPVAPGAAPPAAAAAVVNAVPIPLLFLLPLGLALAWLGLRTLRRQSGRGLLGVLLIVAGLGMGITGGLNIPGAVAVAINMVELDNPDGGTVDIPQSDTVYTNVSGVPLEIGSVVAPPACATTSPADECLEGKVLSEEASCSTVYDCSPVCGNGIVQSGESCDDGNSINEDFCTASCQLAACGDGIVATLAGEQCDDGNLADGDGCSSSCTLELTLPVCGNGIPESGECGTLGTCPADCEASCSPNCSGKVCGDDGCGGSCGSCGGGLVCSDTFMCVAEASPEVCNGLDDDNNNLIDDSLIPPAEACETSNAYGTCGGTWQCGGAAGWSCDAPLAFEVFMDVDGDGFGDPATATGACTLPSGHVTNGDDCDDGNNAIGDGC